MNKRVFSLLIAIFAALTVSSQSERVSAINNNWNFHLGNIDFDQYQSPSKAILSEVIEWETINIPHTWNDKDAIDEIPGYYRGVGWYKKTIDLTAEKREKNVKTEIYFEGANQVTDVYVNGNWVGQHNGGYTRFNFDITEFLNFGESNVLAIKVDNSHNEAIPPLSADFTFFGGIYRDVYLIKQNAIHFLMDDHGSSGVYISTPKVSKEEGLVSINCLINNSEHQNRNLTLVNRIEDNQGVIITEKKKKIKIRKHDKHFSVDEDFVINNPQLWSPDTPYLYQVITQIQDSKTGVVLDESIEPLGLRWFHFDPEEGFFLNGKYLKLIGTNRHQDYFKKGNALTNEIHASDVQLLKEMGGNFLRISHYPQDPVVLETCDRLGILTSIEIPIVNAITESEAFTENSLHMAEEMVKQNFNHPSLIIWAYMNEVLLRPPFDEKTEKERYELYTNNIAKLASKIEDKIRTLDPSRYTMIVNHGAVDRYVNAGLTDISMLLGWNLYQGWYGGVFEHFDKYLDKIHRLFPNKPIIISEYGADVHHRLHSFDSERFDYTVEYGNRYHEHYLKAIMARPFIVGANIWNLNDFYSETRGYAIPNTNLKGITTLNREKKDTWWLYKTKLSKQPIIKFGQNEWKIRGGVAEAGKDYCLQPVTVYSNSDSVQLTHNNIVYNAEVKDYIARFSIPFTNGINKLKATSTFQTETYNDVLKIDFRLAPNQFSEFDDDFDELNVLLGTKRIYEDRVNSMVWIPEQEYAQGSWGYIGGKPYRAKTKFGSLPSSELNIKGSQDDPIYQTQRVGINGFKLDVPNGKYSVTLHWTELESNIKHEKLAYDLGNDRVFEGFSSRIFNVILNGEYIEKNLNISEKYGVEKAVSVKYQISVNDGEGIKINFESVKDLPILNAFQIRKIQ